MVNKIQQTLRDSALARWTVLVLVASMMFFAYMFVDILSPLASLLNETLGWDQGHICICSQQQGQAPGQGKLTGSYPIPQNHPPPPFTHSDLRQFRSDW